MFYKRCTITNCLLRSLLFSTIDFNGLILTNARQFDVRVAGIKSVAAVEMLTRKYHPKKLGTATRTIKAAVSLSPI